MTDSDSKALFVLSTASIGNIPVIMVSYLEHERLSVLDITINRFTPEIIQKEGNMGEESGQCYVFRGVGYFRLIVVLVESSLSTASFMALPLDMWSNNYFLLVAKRSSVIQIIASQAGFVAVRLDFTIGGHRFQWDNQIYKTGEAIRYTFNANQVRTLEFCDHDDFSSLISASVDAVSPIGVILSNCRNEVDSKLCPPSNNSFASVRTRDDLTAEMLVGERHLGTEYVTLHHSRWGTNAMYYVIGHHRQTTVNVTLGETINTSLIDQRDWFVLEPDQKVAHIASDKNVQVVYILHSPECSTGMKEAVMCLLVPTQMFFTRYHWLNWKTSSFYMTFDILIVIKLSYVSSLYLDGKRLSVNSLKWTPVSGNSTWRVGQLSLRGTAHYLLQRNSQPFGCYLHVKGLFTAAMHFVGLKTRECQPSDHPESQSMTLDDDCDEVIDEEVENGMDDDFDLLIDEDINDMRPDVTNVPPRDLHADHTRGLFGPHGKFMCHCSDGNCDADGHCATSTQCAAGWFGAQCQYRDLAVTGNLAERVIYDNDDGTCVMLDVQEIIIELSGPYFHTWVRLVFGNNDVADYFSLTFLEDTSEKIHQSFPCNNVKVYRFSQRIIDLYCLDEELSMVVDVMIAWQGGSFLCSVHASGGRNIALHHPAIRMRELPVRPATSADAKEVVDGSRNKAPEGLMSMGAFKVIDVTLSPLKYVHSLILYLDTWTNGSLMRVELMDEYHNIRFGVNVQIFKPVDEVVNTDPQVLIGRVRLKLISGGVFLNEVEVFGDCAPPYFGLDCSSFCGLSCLNEKCNPAGMCFHCHPKKSGRFCDYASINDPQIDDYLDNSSEHTGNEEERVMGPAQKTPTLLIIACLFPVMGFVPCIIIMMREGKVETVEEEDISQSFVEVQHWPSPELDIPPEIVFRSETSIN